MVSAAPAGQLGLTALLQVRMVSAAPAGQLGLTALLQLVKKLTVTSLIASDNSVGTMLMLGQEDLGHSVIPPSHSGAQLLPAKQCSALRPDSVTEDREHRIGVHGFIATLGAVQKTR
ncbi:hypothetical protein TREES_T100021550 [Tupaia chinensis]|uniref:Uncharacterized protein n=1 Tax=Tupaia chinensis TaxID=246437 RepID=L9KF38_TUPCH|nr:hypothetical protein TREES_T100021550 [Tupaia chinensis]